MPEPNEDELRKHPAYQLAMRDASSGAVDPQKFGPPAALGATATPTATATASPPTGATTGTTPRINPPASRLGPVAQAAAGGLAGIPRQAPVGVVDRPPPVGPPGTAQLSRILTAKAAGQPYVEGGRVNNQPAGTAGMDFNTNTGDWIPKSTVGTINGQPASEAIAAARARNVERRAQIAGAAGALPRVQTAGPTPPVGGTQAVKIIPTSYYAKGGMVRRPVMRMQDGGIVDTIRDRNRDISSLTNDGDFPAAAQPSPTPTPTPLASAPPVTGQEAAAVDRTIVAADKFATVARGDFDRRARTYAGGGKVAGPPVKRDVVPAMLTPGEAVLNSNQQQAVRIMPNFRDQMSPDEADAMDKMNLPRMRTRNQKAINPVNRFAKAA